MLRLFSLINLLFIKEENFYSLANLAYKSKKTRETYHAVRRMK